MSDPVQAQLLGYLLGALEDSEQDLLEKRLSEDPQLRLQLGELQAKLRPLDDAGPALTPPPGLAYRTCCIVASAARAQRHAARHGRQSMRPAVAPGLAGHLRWPDLAVGAMVCVLACLLVMPAVQSSRFAAQLATCQDNLRQLGFALDNYSQRHQDYFPMVPVSGKLAAAGIYAPTLLRGGFLTETRSVVCPASMLGREIDFRVPSLDELESALDDELPQLQCSMGGSYGYCLGHVHHGVYVGTRNRHRSRFALVADVPNADLPGHQSGNHGGRGQNVLFEDGHVAFLNGSRLTPAGDDIFLNDAGQVAAGVHPDDAVIGPSDARPLIFVQDGR